MQSLVQSPAGPESQESAENAVLMGALMEESSRRWTNLLACGALTPGLLSLLALSVGFGGSLAVAPAAQAEPTLLAASEATGPLVSFQQPTHADQLSGKAQIGINIAGRRYPAKWVELLVDDYSATKGGPVQLDSSMLPLAHFEWDTRVYADGPHKLSVIITDSQGFKGRSDVQVYINNKGGQDIIPPTVRWVNVRNGDVLRGDFPVQVDATDNFGVKWVIVSLNPAISPTMKPALRGALLNIPPYIFRLNTAGLPASRYVLNAEAFDALDNRGTAPPIEVLIGPAFLSSGGGGGYAIPTPSTPDKTTIDIPPTPSGPSGGNDTANTGATGRNINPIAPDTTTQNEGSGSETPSTPSLNRGAGEAGTADTLPGVTGELPSERTTRQPSTGPVIATLPNSEQRLATATAKMTRPASPLSGADSTPVLPAETRSTLREPRVARLNASRPEATRRDLPRAGEVAAAKRNTETLPPVTAPVGSSSASNRTNHVAQSAMPQAEKRIATASVKVQNETPVVETGTPQLSRGNMSSVDSNVALNESHAVKAQINAQKLASMPTGVARALPKSASAPQLTRHANVANSGISRAFPETKAHRSLGPTVAILPAAIKAYPDLPTPNLLPNMTVGSSSGPLMTVPRVMPPHFNTRASRNAEPLPPASPQKLPTIPVPTFAMNAAMPKTGALRPLESITVAPAPQWGTQAAVLPATHTVLRNESLSSIARRYKMPVAVLAAANNLKPTAGLQMGAKLHLPHALQVTYGGQPIKTDAASFMMGSVGVTPFRFLFEKQGGKLDWNAKTRQVTAKGPQGNIQLTIGSRTAVVNEKDSLMDLAAFLMSGRTMVPVRFFEQALHAQVEWDPATGRLYVATGNPAPSTSKG